MTTSPPATTNNPLITTDKDEIPDPFKGLDLIKHNMLDNINSARQGKVALTNNAGLFHDDNDNVESLFVDTNDNVDTVTSTLTNVSAIKLEEEAIAPCMSIPFSNVEKPPKLKE